MDRFKLETRFVVKSQHLKELENNAQEFGLDIISNKDSLGF